MIKVHDAVTCLRVKWMWRFWMDQGQTWSWFIWRQVLSVVLREVILGTTFVADSWIEKLHPFYQDML